MAELINGTSSDPASGDAGEPPVHLLLGGNGISALGDSLQADAASRLLLHCCTARDSVFQLDLPYVFGLFTPASLYTGPVLRTMALRGTRRVAMAYDREDPLYLQLCEGALRQLPQLGELRPGFGPVAVLNYSVAEAEAPGFWDAASAAIAKAGADVLIACDDMSRTSLLVRRLRSIGLHLSAVWLASWGGMTDFLTYLGDGGEYALTTVQWMPSLPYADAAFGTAGDYAAAFLDATGRKPSYFSAAATAAGYVLLTSLRRVVAQCSLERVAASAEWASAADSFMWQEGALSCGTAPRTLDVYGSTGSLALRYVMSTLDMETFFGPVSFNGLRQNIHHPAIVTQVMGGDLVTVLPLDVADRALVMPIPGPAPRPATWAATPAGIAIIVLSCCLGATCLALALVACTRRLTPRLSIAKAVEVNLDEIKVEIAPAMNADGSFELGEGVYRGMRVKLVVAEELLPPPPPASKLSRHVAQGASSPSAIYEERDPVTTLSPGRRSFPIGRRSMEDSRDLRSLPTGGTTDSAAAAVVPSSPPGAHVALTAQRSGTDHAPDKQLLGKQSTSELPTSSTGLVGPQNVTITCSPSPPISPFVGSVGMSKQSRRRALGMVWRGMRLHHPCVCPIIGIVWEWPGLVERGGPVPVLLRQWHEFDSLDRLLENETLSLPLITKAHIAQGVADAICFLHAQKPPIIAGPIEASRIIIGRDFSPRLFLRLCNLNEAYGSEPTCPPGAVRPRMSSLFAGRGSANLLSSSNAAPAPTPGPGPAQAHARALRPAPSGSLLLSSVRLATDDGYGRLSTEGPAAGALNSAPPQGRFSLGESPWPTLRNTAAASAAPPPPPYLPSQQQDVQDFGVLLCLLFSTRVRSDSGRLALLSCAATGSLEPAAATPATAAQAARQQQEQQQLEEEEEVEAVLDELTEIIPELGGLASACLRGEERPAAAAVAHFMATRVLPAFGASGTTAGAFRTSKLNLGSPLLSVGRSGLFAPAGGEAVMVAPRAASQMSLASGLDVVFPDGSPTLRSRSARISGCGRVRANHAAFTPDDLIFDIFPPKVARALQAGEPVQPERYEIVSLFFSDVVGYTEICSKLQPYEVMDLLHRLYSRFDDLIRSMRLFKVETVGDAYLAVSNLRWQQPECHARLIAQFAFEAVRAANSLPVHPDRPEMGCVHVRVGLHCGPVVGSVVGTLNRRFCLFGDAVNTAARMEHESKVDRVHCSAAFASLLREQWPEGVALISRGVRQIKGKGPMETFWVAEQPGNSHAAITCSPTARMNTSRHDAGVTEYGAGPFQHCAV